MENDETPVGEGPRRDPTESAANEEARQFPHRKASYFPSIPNAYHEWLRTEAILKLSLPYNCY
ncbi:hypothetical protein HM131_02905 [Halobacillus mangrovi]|uniref:Uncharacterized protein n=1 Tax=Halobacillus mangrovi TaxID=402384 RepID=A0A1W5ZRB0_9BACI|nr:hypothetical protein HM131_02905 [Halobacillus mangrovi]